MMLPWKCALERFLLRGPALAVLAAVAAGALPAQALEFGLPVQCKLGEDCFVQQFPDVDTGPGFKDAFCGTASYDGHDGIDLRVRSMSDVERRVPVVAMQSGKVLRVRDGVPDHLVENDADRAAVQDRECGNGVVVEHTDGFETQYCHMRQGSLLVAPGAEVKEGQALGDVGASGLAAFPHVHVTVRKDGKVIDPVSGHALADGCGLGTAGSLLSEDVLRRLGNGAPQLVGSGVTDGPVEEENLVRVGPPQSVQADSTAVVAWAWVINLGKGDELTVSLVGPDGQTMSEQAVPPLDRSKATYVAFAGKRRVPPPGQYGVHVLLKRGADTLIDRTTAVTVH